MSIRNFEVAVTSYYEVEIDTSKFTKQVMDDFEEVMYEMGEIEGHAEHIAAMLHRRGEGTSDGVELEGYGDLAEVGGRAEHIDEESSAREKRP